MMRGETVETEKPRPIAIFRQEMNCLFRAPGRLMMLGGNAIFPECTSRWRFLIQVLPFHTLRTEPRSVGIIIAPIGLRMMRPVKIVIPIIDSRLDLLIGAGSKVEFPRQAAAITHISKHLREKNFVNRHLLTVLPTARRARIPSCQKTGPARRANWRLAECIGPVHALANKAIQIRRIDSQISQRTNRVESLLIGTEPENVRFSLCFRHGI